MDSKPKRRGGPLVRQILEAALAEIARAGIDRLSIERVADLADVNKTTIYRRWKTIDALVDAALDLISHPGALPDSGSLRSDLVEFLERMQSVAKDPAVMPFLRLRLAGSLDGQYGPLIQKRMQEADRVALVLFARARRRGEIDSHADIEMLRDIVLGATQYVLLTRIDAPPSPTLLADVLMNGLQAIRRGVA